MFGLEDLMKQVDLGDILEKVGLSDADKATVTSQAADAVKYRVNKENARGNVDTIKNLFSQNDNSESANGIAKKLEGDLAFNLKSKGMSSSIIDTIKSAVMSKFLGGTTNALAANGDKDGGGIMDMFGDSDLMNTLKSKLGGFFK